MVVFFSGFFLEFVRCCCEELCPYNCKSAKESESYSSGTRSPQQSSPSGSHEQSTRSGLGGGETLPGETGQAPRYGGETKFMLGFPPIARSLVNQVYAWFTPQG